MDSSQKLTNTDVKKLNKNRIFRLIYNSDKISRQEIADQLGLSLPTVNQNLKMLMEDGLIEYVGNFTSTGGRRAQAITIDNNARKAISVNIKADYINVDVVGLKGQIIYSMAVKAHFSKSSAYIEKLKDAVRHAVDYVGADADDILGVGITVLSSELDMTLDNFFELAVQGNKNNSNVLDEYMDNLALGINNIYTMMDCDIVLGGTVAPYLKQYENSIKERLVNDYSFDTDADYLRISDGGGRKSGLGAALSFVARFIDGVE